MRKRSNFGRVLAPFLSQPLHLHRAGAWSAECGDPFNGSRACRVGCLLQTHTGWSCQTQRTHARHFYRLIINAIWLTEKTLDVLTRNEKNLDSKWERCMQHIIGIYVTLNSFNFFLHRNWQLADRKLTQGEKRHKWRMKFWIMFSGNFLFPFRVGV